MILLIRKQSSQVSLRIASRVANIVVSLEHDWQSPKSLWFLDTLYALLKSD